MVFPFVTAALLLSALTVYLCGLSGVNILLFGLLYFVLYFIGIALLFCAVLFVMSLTVNIDEPQKKDSLFFRNMTAFALGFMLKLLRVKVSVSGLENIPEGRFLLVQNHRSMFDPLVSLCAFNKYQLGFITKPENMKIPVIGKFAHRICCLPIDRVNARNAVKTINAAADYLKNDVCSVGLYPEGTRNRQSGGEILPFRNGSLKIATKAGVPVVVTSISGTELVKRNAPFKKTAVELKVCGVVPAETVSASTTAELSEITRKLLCDGLGLPFKENTDE